MATKQGHVQMVQILLEKGAKPDPFESCSVERLFQRSLTIYKGPLHFAAEAGHVEVVKLLLEKGACLEWVKSGKEKNTPTPLYSATKNGHQEVVDLLTEEGAKREAEKA